MNSTPTQASTAPGRAGVHDLHGALRFHDVGGAEIAYRIFGSGPPLLLLHGWPLSGLTYRKLIPHLAPRFTCYAIDLPGAGETRWQVGTDFSFRGQAATVRRFIEGLGLAGVHVVAHDTGATIARALALLGAERLGKLVLMGTEIPGHRPPWIPLFQRLTALPGAGMTFRILLSSDRFLRSPMAFGNCFTDRRLIGGEFSEHFVRPLVASPTRMDGQMRYLKGIDWAFVDQLAEDHRKITNPVMLIWGEQDTIFPPDRARIIADQLADCRGFQLVAGAKLLVHEEQPAAVAAHVLEFLA